MSEVAEKIGLGKQVEVTKHEADRVRMLLAWIICTDAIGSLWEFYLFGDDMTSINNLSVQICINYESVNNILRVRLLIYYLDKAFSIRERVLSRDRLEYISGLVHDYQFGVRHVIAAAAPWASITVHTIILDLSHRSKLIIEHSLVLR